MAGVIPAIFGYIPAKTEGSRQERQESREYGRVDRRTGERGDREYGRGDRRAGERRRG